MSVDDLSLEPLFNQSSVGDGSARRIAFIPIDAVGVAAHRTAVAVNNTAQAITISANKASMEIQNTGSKIIYIGGLGVTSATGIKLFQNQGKLFSNVKDSFSIYIVTDGADTSTLRILEYD